MKRIILAAAALALGASIATAAPTSGKHKTDRHVSKHQANKLGGYKSRKFTFRKGRHHAGRLTRQERRKIARSEYRLSKLKRRIWADGRVTFLERKRLRIARIRHRALVRRARRS